MANFNFGAPIPVGFNFYFGTTYTGTETVFNFLISGYGYGVYDFEFGDVWIKQLIIKSTATPGYIINSINIEHINNGDILYINTTSGIVRAFSLTCSGIIDNRNIVSSDYESGACGEEKVAAGYDTKLIEINTASGTEESFEVVNSISKVLYYTW
jgi:hypothetical protein